MVALHWLDSGVHTLEDHFKNTDDIYEFLNPRAIIYPTHTLKDKIFVPNQNCKLFYM